MNRKGTGLEFLHDVWYLTKSYWQSEEKKKASLLLGAIILLTIGIVYMLILLNQWNNAFYTALQNYDAQIILKELWHFTYLAFIYIILSVYAFYLQQVLALKWRQWLTERYIDEWLAQKTYYRLQMFGGSMDNPDQRISEDIRLFVEMTLRFSIGLLRAFCILVAFVFILWQLSGPFQVRLGFINFNLPGYLVWVALIYSIIGTVVTHLVGKKLVGLNFVQQKYEANFRFSMMRMRENSKSVAFYNGEQKEGEIFKHKFSVLLKNFWNIIAKQKQLVWINSGYSQIAIIFPFVVTIPRYLSKEITLGGLMQVASAFGKVQESLSYFVDMYASIAEWKAVVERLTGFGLHMRTVKDTMRNGVLEKVDSAKDIVIENMQVMLPQEKTLLHEVNFILKRGEHALVKGLSGSGKSTLLRALAGIWPYVSGKIGMPLAEKIMFIPQKPYLPLGSLKVAALYPGTQSCTDEQLIKLLEECQIGYLAKELEVERDWSQVLSVGEQQRLAFVRTLIYQPQWLFLDEATSALDEATEAKMYKLILAELPQVTIVSVGHRSTLSQFHTVELYLDKATKTLTKHSL